MNNNHMYPRYSGGNMMCKPELLLKLAKMKNIMAVVFNQAWFFCGFSCGFFFFFFHFFGFLFRFVLCFCFCFVMSREFVGFLSRGEFMFFTTGI